MKKSRMHQFLIAIDQVINTIFSGWADETLSARAYRCSKKSKKWNFFMKLINGIFFWQENHCLGSYQNEMVRSHLPPEYRG